MPRRFITVDGVEYIVTRESSRTYHGEPDDRLIYVEWLDRSSMQLDDGQSDEEAVAAAIRQSEIMA